MKLITAYSLNKIALFHGHGLHLNWVCSSFCVYLQPSILNIFTINLTYKTVQRTA